MHRITPSPAINLVEVRLSGTISSAEAGKLGAEFEALFALGKLKPGYRLLIDAVECAIQTQESLASLTFMLGRMPKAERIAVLVGSAVLQLQAGRVMKQPYLRIVPDRQSAFAWLNHATEPARAA